MRSAFLTVAVFMLIPLGAASAQAVQPRNGDRIRLTAPALDNRIAHVLSIRSDSLLLLIAPAETLAVARVGVTRLEVNTGRRNYPLRGAGMGVLIGFASGVLIAAAGGDSHYKAREMALFYGTAMTVPGLIIGSVVGTLKLTDRWTSIPIGVAKATPSLHMSGGGARLGVTVSVWP